MQGAGSLQHAELLPRRSLDTFGLVDKRRALPLRSSQYKHLLKRGKELDYSRMFGAPKKSKEKKEEKKEEKEEVKKAKQEEQGPSSAAMQTQAEGTSSAGGTSLERSSSPDWKTLDPATRDPGQVLADSQRPHAVERVRARFQQDPLAYDRVRNTDAWTIVHPGRLEWSPTPPGRRLVLTGLGECLAVIAFTERGALAFHVQTRNDANTRWKDRREHEADARRFARTLKAHVGHATPPVRLHVVASDHLYTGRWMGEAYKANLQAALGAVGLRHDRILTQHYPKPASPAKERYNVVRLGSFPRHLPGVVRSRTDACRWWIPERGRCLPRRLGCARSTS